MDDMTTVIPVIRTTGIAYVNQAAEVHSITVIVSALQEASALVSNASQIPDESDRQRSLREAEECAGVAMTYLAALIKSPAGSRVQWNSGYSTYAGTIVQTMDDGRYMVVPDGADPMFMFPHECEIIP
jgi:hypothetical protein